MGESKCEEAMANCWLKDEEVRKYHHSTHLLRWTNWIAKNETISKGKLYTQVQILRKVQHTCFFDRASKENSGTCGAGGILFLSNSHRIPFECGLRRATNTFAERKAVYIIMVLSLEQDISSLQVFGDSKLVNFWMKGAV